MGAVDHLVLALDVAREAGELLSASFRRGDARITHKGEIDLVTEADLASEALVRRRLDEGSGLPVLAEEGGLSGSGGGLEIDRSVSGWGGGVLPHRAAMGEDRGGGFALWMVDPLDGTTNFAHRFPHFAVSIGLWNGDRPSLGVVHSPMENETFWSDGESAWLNGQRLPPIRECRLERSLLATGFPYDRRISPDNNSAHFAAFSPLTQGLRRLGAAALDLAWVAAGRLNGFWEPRLKPWDVCAGMSLVRSVGGLVTDYHGRGWHPDSDSVVAAPPALHAEMLAVIGPIARR